MASSSSNPLPSGQKWWKSAAVYQIYPASFKDSNGDGIGDLPGILSKLDYLSSLGIDAIWISPFYESPNYDYGYDISDYKKPDPMYGKMEDIEAIIEGAHSRGLKVLFDLVINHTSHLHPWFKDAESSKDSKYRDYYIWRPPRYDADGNRLPPTNWRAVFGGSVWEYSEATGEYYLHFFTKEQPDLNWEIEEVRDAIFDEAITFWLKKGVDGFRVDATTMYSKRAFEDWPVTSPDTYEQPAHGKLDHGPRLGEFVQDMVKKTFVKYDSFTIAETAGDLNFEVMLESVAEKQAKFNVAIGFDVLGLDHDPEWVYYPREWSLKEFKTKTALAQQLTDPQHAAWECNYLENHDHGRSVSRFGDDSPEHRGASAKMLATYVSTLSGTLLIYQGQEIGMTNVPESWDVKEYIDPAAQNYWRDIQAACKAPDSKYTIDKAWQGLLKTARDHSRTPFQWSSEAMGGFSTGSKTWMRVNDNYTDLNVDCQESQSSSVLNHWRKLLKLRKQHQSTFVFGLFEVFDEENTSTFSYLKRALDGKEVLHVVLNFTGKEAEITPPPSGLIDGKATLLLSSANRRPEESLAPWEGRIYLYTQ